MYKNMILIITLMAGYTQASDEPVVLSEEQAQVHGLYSSNDPDKEVNEQNIACAILNCDITQSGRLEMYQHESRTFEVYPKWNGRRNDSLNYRFVQLGNDDIIIGDKRLSLKLSQSTLVQMKALDKSGRRFRIRLHKKIDDAKEATLLWKLQNTAKEVIEKKEQDFLFRRLSSSTPALVESVDTSSGDLVPIQAGLDFALLRRLQHAAEKEVEQDFFFRLSRSYDEAKEKFDSLLK